MDVELPDGTVIQDVPEGTSKADLVAKLKARGYDTSWYQEAPSQSSVPQTQPAIQQSTPSQEKPPVTLPRSGADKFLGNVLGGPIETGMSMASGMGASALGGLAGLGELASGGTVDDASQRIQETQQSLTYQPRTDAGQAITSGIGEAFGWANQQVGKFGGIVGSLFGKELEGKMIGEVALPIGGTLVGAGPMLRAGRAISDARAVPRNSAQIEQMQKTAAQAEAAKTARELGITLNPAESNPTMTNRTLAAAAGDPLNKNVVKANLGVPELIVKRDLGLSDDARLTVETLKELRAEVAKPIQELKNIERIEINDAALSRLNALKLDELVTEGAKTVNKRIDNITNAITDGVSGERLWGLIRALRSDANKGMGSADVKVANLAEAKLKIAKTLETALDDHLAPTDPALLGRVRDARAKLAKTYAVEKSLNTATERVDMRSLASAVKKDNAITGDLAKLADVAANYPDAFIAAPKSRIEIGKDFGKSQLVRTGIPGTVGAVVGTAFGSPLVGGAVGAGLGEIGGMLLGKRLTSPGAQARRVVPPQLVSPIGTGDPTKGMLTGEVQ